MEILSCAAGLAWSLFVYIRKSPTGPAFVSDPDGV
jgi:hypothetical protein